MKISFEFFIGYKLGYSNDTQTRIQELFEIYSNFGDDYEKFLGNLVLSEVRDIVAQYEAFDLFQKREDIGNTMFSSIYSAFQEYHFELM